jgi:DNA-binding transcriptional ArsR family regulator
MKALSVPVRRALFELICDRPRSVAELAEMVPVSRPAVSQHLAVLVDAELIRVTPVGTRNLYAACPEATSMLRSWLDDMWTTAFGTFADFVTPESEKERRTMDKALTIDPVVKTLELEVTPEHAFDVFVNNMGAWWPVLTHSVAIEEVQDVLVDDRVGGTIREVTRDGVEHEWGTITAYTEGERIQFTWHPGAPADQSTHVDVRFDAAGSGTRVTLLHTGWEVRGDDGKRIRDNYDSGWELVLAPYVAATGD